MLTMDGGKIWELKRKLEKKVQTPYSVTKTEGIKLENRSDMQEEYTKYYKTLLKNTITRHKQQKAEHLRKGIKNCKDGKGKDKFQSEENKICDS